ncbi:MAG TPA: GNAT family N-acetyltransferase [Trebonia sp.]
MRWDPSDTETARACHEVQQAALAADDSLHPPKSFGVFRVWLTGGWSSDPGEVWYVPGESGGVVAWCRLELPDLENRDRAFASPVVHPAARRGGIGTALLRHAARRAAANGREMLDGVALQNSPGALFARRMGATPTLHENRRVLDVAAVPAGRAASIREEAARAAAGYSLLSWSGPTPEEHLGQVAAVYNAFADAPRGEGVEPEVWDARRVRERADSFLRVGAARGYTVTAAHNETGEMAAITQVEVDPEYPEWGWQGLTAVTRPHRGHRLGLLVKAAMLEWLAETEPKIERIETGNASTNKHMIAVNEALGFQLAENGWQFYELPVSSVVEP